MLFLIIMLLCYVSPLFSLSHIHQITSDDICTPELKRNAIIRQEPGFEKDFLVLHCLIKQFNPRTIFEIGTCEGYGTLIMAHACPESHIISLELPPLSIPYFISANRIGCRCNRPFTQVYGDSMTYDYAQHMPIDAWFIDGAHDYSHVLHETLEAIKLNSPLIIYHDTDIPEVLKAVVDGLNNSNYSLYRVIDTRISYAIKNK